MAEPNEDALAEIAKFEALADKAFSDMPMGLARRAAVTPI
jgi:hypothetical protein